MLYGLPVSFGILILTFVVVRTHGRWNGFRLSRKLEIPDISDDEASSSSFHSARNSQLVDTQVRDLLKDLGPIKWDERVVLVSFGVLVAMWMLREPQVLLTQMIL